MDIRWQIAIATFAAGLFMAFVRFMVKRLLKTFDDDLKSLKSQVASWRQKAVGFATKQEMEMQLAEIRRTLQDMRNDARAREDRIVDAIKESAQASRDEANALRKDVSQVHQRIDTLRDRTAH